MADVQLEHGHVRIANRLAEAMLDAEFSGSQFKILHGLIRLTYGWRRRTVTLSHAELAAYLHTTASGTFRAALRELITEGVVLQLEQGAGHTKSTLAIQKDFTRWGKFSVAPERLARVFGARPASADEMLGSTTATEDPPPAEPDESLSAGVPTTPPAHNEAGRVPENGQAGSPKVGRGTPAKWVPPLTMPPKKDSDRQGNTDDYGAARERELFERLAVASEEITLFLSQFEGVRRTSWVGRLHELIDSPPHFTPDEIRVGMAAFTSRLDKSEQGPIALRAFCQRARDDAANPPEARPAGAARETRRSTGADDVRVWAEVLDVVEKLRGRRMSADEFNALSRPMRSALRHVGGWQAIAEAATDRLPHVREDFLRAYRAAAA